MHPEGPPRPTRRPRYRFAEFVVSTSERTLTHNGREVSLIGRYFDLLALLIARRGEAIHRQEILDVVWSDVVVSDGALTQAIRAIRRALGDDPRQPTFIRTVQRHGYRFVFPDVTEEPDGSTRHVRAGSDGPTAAPDEAAPQNGGPDDKDTEIQALVDLLLQPSTSDQEPDARRDAAERLHALGVEEALRRIGRRPGHITARALLRETRWDVPGAGRVPILGQPGAVRASWILLAARSHRVWRIAGRRWLAAVGGASLAGLLAGLAGAVALRFGPGSTATNVVFAALPLVGVVIGNLGAAGVAAGLLSAEVLFRSRRAIALVLCGAAGGGLIGATTHWFGRLALEGMFGGDLAPVAGGFEGLIIGGTIGLGYALATPMPDGGMAAPRGRARVRVAVIAGIVCAVGTAAMGMSGRYLGALSLDLLARTFPDSQVGLGPLAHLLGEARVGPVTRAVVSGFEGLMFGTGLVAGLTTRPRTR